MTANPNATIAAAAVFRNRESQQHQSLSSAAAAAALRARPTTPTNVANVQTARTLRRSASVSSAGNGTRTRRPPSLHRRGSSSSMAEKSFRASSPHQPAPTSFGHPREAPPVPALPDSIDSHRNKPDGATRQKQPQGRKANGLGISSTPVRVASQELGKQGTPSFFGGAQVTTPGPPVQASDDGRPSSRSSSINFSYPARVRVGSPPPASPVESRTPEFGLSPADRRAKRASSTSSSTRARPASTSIVQSVVYDPNSRRMVPRYETAPDAVGSRAAAVETGSRQKSASPKARPHSTHGAVGAKRGMHDEPEPRMHAQPMHAPSHSTRATEPDNKSRQNGPESYHEDPSAVRATISSQRLEGRKAEQQYAQVAPGKADGYDANAVVPSLPGDAVQLEQSLRRQPSVVREEPDLETEDQGLPLQQSLPDDELDAAPTRQNAYASNELPARPDLGDPSRGHPNSQPSRQSVQYLGESLHPCETVVSSEPGAASGPSRHRTNSTSPARTAHFGTVQESPAIRYSPPPRSLSPRKSALKQRSSSRDLSPDGTVSEASGSVVAGEEAATPRKKSVRVSFHEADGVAEQQAEIADAPGLQESASRRPLVRGAAQAERDIAPGEDEIMKPRPALPCFGSVRGKKPRELGSGGDGRPLIKPYETRAEVGSHGTSTDSALAGLLHQQVEQGSRNPANISRYREPLPPLVTSVDRNGYASDSESESGRGQDAAQAARGWIPVQSGPSNHDGTPAATGVEASSVAESAASPTATGPGSATIDEAVNKDAGAEVPEITISQPTPPQPRVSLETYFDVPGGFPSEESHGARPHPEKKHNEDIRREAVLKPAVQQEDKTNSPQTPATVLATAPAPGSIDGVDDDSGSSIYSDAYEDLSEMDGFMSLDAVVDSPISPASTKSSSNAKASKQASSPASQHSPPKSVLPKLLTDFSATTAVESPPPGEPQDEWERAKAYWRSLSAERRVQLEKEASEDAGVEGDMEESAGSSTKVKKKKSLERRNSERRALAAHLAQQEVAKQQDRSQRTTAVERDYTMAPGAKAAEGGYASSARSAQSAPPMRHTLRQDRAASGHLSGRTLRAKSPDPRGTRGHARQLSDQSSAAGPAGGKGSVVAPGPLRRRGSSGSESSFIRSRVGDGEAPSFRRTLRQSSPAAGQDPSTKRFSLRSLSPPGSRLGRSPPPAGAGLRQSLRDSPGDAGRNSGLRLAGFGRASGKDGPREPKHAGSKAPSSRFGDSSDEDDAATRPRFHSRFDDSSDDDASPQTARPHAMGRTMRAGGGKPPAPAVPDSPLLPEEEELSDAGLGQQQAENPAAPGGARRKGIMDVLRRRKHSSAQAQAADGELGEDRARSPRLQKRATAPPWPLPDGRQQQQQQQQHDEPGGQPENLDGKTLSGSTAVAAAHRRPSDGHASDVLGEGKKKRFGALRRMFRLPD